MIQIGPKIKQLRLAQGTTQETLALQLGVTAQAISRWENETSLPDISMLPALSYFFHVSIDWLLSDGSGAASSEVAGIQKEFYEKMDVDRAGAEQLLREGLKKYPGNEDLLLNLLWILRQEDQYEVHQEERIALCRRLCQSNRVDVCFCAKAPLAKDYAVQGYDTLAKELLEELPYLPYTSLEIQAQLLDGEDSFQAAQREKTASLARLISMLQVLGAHYAQRGQHEEALTMINIAQRVLDSFQSDIPYRFPANDAPTQTYAAFQRERERLSAQAAVYQI